MNWTIPHAAVLRVLAASGARLLPPPPLISAPGPGAVLFEEVPPEVASPGPWRLVEGKGIVG